MDQNPGGVMDMQLQESMNTLVSLQIQLARIEEGIKPLTALVPAIAEVKDVSKEALQCAQQTSNELGEVKAALKQATEVANEANRRAEEANRRLDKQEEWNGWLKKAILAPVLTTLIGLTVTAVWAVIKLGGQ
ncbi:hypothetical protein [Paenibacillus sp. M2]|uniref:hypothetical protein n=1 Tax=Paenibacillus sp. M2 TaxID=3341793 RepID=UPI00398A20A9